MIFPAGVPLALAASRTLMVVAETVPPDGVSVMVDPNPAPEVVEIS